MKLFLASLALSAVSLAVAGFALYASRRPVPQGAPADESASRPPVPGTGSSFPANPPPAIGTSPAPVDRALLERLDRLDERIAALEKKKSSGGPDPEEEALGKKELEAMVLDGTKTPVQRVSALKKLRRHSPACRTIEVVRSMLDLLRVCEDATARMEICRQLAGVDYPEVVGEMLTRLRNDTDDRTRAEAAGVLESFIDEPGVLQALETAKESDPSERVRASAQDVLEYTGAHRR